MSKEKHWIDNADSYICPVCRFECDNPNKYDGCKCPKCGFQDEKDRKQIEEMAQDFYSLIPDYDVNERDCRSAAEGMYDKGWRKQIEGEWEKRDFIIFDFVKTAYRCTSCNTTWDAPTKFCPNCGAKMKGGE